MKNEISLGGFVFDPARGQWSLSQMDEGTYGVHGVGCLIEADGAEIDPFRGGDVSATTPAWIDDAFGTRRSVRIRSEICEPELSVILEVDAFTEKPAVLVRLEILNRSDRPVKLGRCLPVVLEPACGGALSLGPDVARQTAFHCTCTPALQSVKRLASEDGVHDTHPVCHIHNPQTGKTYQASFCTFDRAQSGHEIRYDADDDCLRHRAYSDFNGYSLAPEQAIYTERIMIEIADDPYVPLEHWADGVNLTYHPPIPDEALVGWVGWAWVDGFTTGIPEELVDRNTAAIRDRLAGFDIGYVWISIANLKGGLPGNWLEFNRDRFPSGMDVTLERLRERDFKPGFWMAPFYVNEGSTGFEENRDNVFRTADGAPRPGGTWLWAYKADEDRQPALYHLDGSHPKTIAYLTRIMTAYREMGICYFMLDFLDSGMPKQGDEYHDKRRVKGLELYRNAVLALRRAAGPELHLLPATGAGLKNIGVANSSRIGRDYGEGRSLLPRFKSYPATYEINGAEASFSTPHRNALQNAAASYFTHRRFWLNNLNVLTVDKPISRNEAEISVSLFGLSGSPIMLGDEIDRIHDERLAMIKKVLPRSKTTAFPVDLFKRVYPEDYARILKVDVKTDWGDWAVAGLFNLDEEAVRISFTAAESGLAEGRSYRVFDFWQERYCGEFSESRDIEVPAFGCRVLRLDATRDHPWILGTDMHVRQGEHELDRVQWHDDTFVLEGVATRPAGEQGTLYLVAPAGWKPRNHEYRTLSVAKDSRDGSLIMRKPLEFVGERLKWSVAFERFRHP